ncbi:MAG: LPS export ABC transporter periplasmic protein LptC [Rhodocyclaceae bacterium]|nr:LPS export ABC transporter periplasmic protein LptC [Rhodocyclaceae bacterium]
MSAWVWRLTRFLPLVFFSLLAALAYWLDQATRAASPQGSKEARREIDALIEDFEARRYGPDGALLHRLQAQRLRHYTDQASEIEHPTLLWQKEPPLSLTAERAYLTDDGKRVEFVGQVLLRREATATRPATELATDRLIVWPDEETALSESKVDIVQGASWVVGAKLTADQKAGLYQLEGPVRGEFYRRTRSNDASTARAETDKVAPTSASRKNEKKRQAPARGKSTRS